MTAYTCLIDTSFAVSGRAARQLLRTAEKQRESLASEQPENCVASARHVTSPSSSRYAESLSHSYPQLCQLHQNDNLLHLDLFKKPVKLRVGFSSRDAFQHFDTDMDVIQQQAQLFDYGGTSHDALLDGKSFRIKPEQKFWLFSCRRRRALSQSGVETHHRVISRLVLTAPLCALLSHKAEVQTAGCYLGLPNQEYCHATCRFW
jgi:hypothetical protein